VGGKGEGKEWGKTGGGEEDGRKMSEGGQAWRREMVREGEGGGKESWDCGADSNKGKGWSERGE